MKDITNSIMRKYTIAIQSAKGGFDKRWINFCKTEGIEFKLVDSYKNNIVQQLEGCDAFMWQFYQANPKDIIFAKQLLFSLQQSGKKVFPDFNTAWHFDDKVGQKYLLEAIGSPLVPSFVFYSKQDAFEWIEKTSFPKVFKLRGGAGSANVRLVHSKQQAIKLVNKAFGRGFSQNDSWSGLKERWRKFRLGKGSLSDIVKGFVRFIYPTEFAKMAGREKGYIYFQDFIPSNDHDIRVIVIGKKAFAIKRMVRKNDFRASGSGTILYDKHHFNESVIKLAFEIHNKLQSKCTAMDFVYQNNQPLLVEISYGFSPEGYDPCPGYWDAELNWHKGEFDPYGWMVEEALK